MFMSDDYDDYFNGLEKNKEKKRNEDNEIKYFRNKKDTIALKTIFISTKL
jgi:hypothetical protein